MTLLIKTMLRQRAVQTVLALTRCSSNLPSTCLPRLAWSDAAAGCTAVRACSASIAEVLPRSWLSGPAGPRFLSSSSSKDHGKQQQSTSAQELATSDADGRSSAITDQIPQRPVGVVEGTSYSVMILAALGLAGAVLWAAVNELLLEPKEYKCFNLALDKLRHDPRVTVRLGTPITGYGSESLNRRARQRVPHRIYQDDQGREHVQVQFYARGPTEVGKVSADLYKDGSSEWQFKFLYVDIDGRIPQRILLVNPQPDLPTFSAAGG